MLVGSLTSATREVFNKHQVKLADLINIGGYPEDDEDSGVYLHILKSGDRFYLYVGQGYNIKERVGFHNDEVKRATYPSLHYSIWDQIKNTNRFSSIFVKLAAFGHRPRNAHEQLMLNLEEMFMAIVLQTLQPSDLERWLPDGIPRVWQERGLNVALPLWQGYKMEGASSYDEVKMSGEDFSRLLRDKDDLRRAWAIHLRDAYQSLREHPDLKHQQVWFTNFEKFLRNKKLAIETAHAVHQKTAQENARNFVAHGKIIHIYQTDMGYYSADYSQYCFNLGIPRSELEQHVKANPRRNVSGQEKNMPATSTRYGKVDGKFAFIKPVLFNRPHTLRYARDALPSDPASCLMILADTDRGDGSGKLRILSVRRQYAIKSMNRFVDLLEGIDYYDSIQLGRRLVHKKDRKMIEEVMKAKKLGAT